MSPQPHEFRKHFEIIRAAALTAVDPALAVARAFTPQDLAGVHAVYLVGAGKAGVAMAGAAAVIAGSKLTKGIMSVPAMPASVPERVTFFKGGHPLPTQGSIDAAAAMADLLANTTADDLVIALISGGGSALLELPWPGLSLNDLQATTDALLKCGATIHEVNTVRGRLSLVKRGGLARMAAPARVLGLILSDVVGNALDAIASGPMVPLECNNAGNALAVLEKYRLTEALPHAVLACLQSARSDIKNHTTLPDRIENRCIACNRMAGEAAVAAAQELGYHGIFLGDDWQGEAREVGWRWAQRLLDYKGKKPACLMAGGESTVVVRGSGKGGRNQEAALAAAFLIKGRPDCMIACCATDGVDGPTDAAGALVTAATLTRAQSHGLDPRQFLDNNDSYTFFSALGDLVLGGPTGTNVNDLLFGFVYE